MRLIPRQREAIASPPAPQRFGQSLYLLQTVLSQFDGTARRTLSGEINAGSVSRGTDVIDDNGASSIQLAYGQNDIGIGPGHYATIVADTV